MTHPKKERTFVILKPDAIQRGLVGDILSRFEKSGLKTIAMKMVVATEDQCFTPYNKDDVWFEKKGAKVVENMQSRGVEPTKPAPITAIFLRSREFIFLLFISPSFKISP